MRDTARIAIGSRLLRDGEMCEVIALEAAEAVVMDRLGSAARVRIADLLRPAGQAELRLAEAAGGPTPAGERPGVLLGAAGDSALAEARWRAGHVREVLSGYRSGSGELAAPGEPRPQYAPGVPLMQRYEAKAGELGVTSGRCGAGRAATGTWARPGWWTGAGRRSGRPWRGSTRGGRMPAGRCWMSRLMSPA